MEAAVLLGLVAVGYLKNKKDDGDNPIITNVNSNVNMSNGENIYDKTNTIFMSICFSFSSS